MRFLIIDDCAISRKLLSTFFAPYGSSECADNGGLGLDLFCKASRSPEPFDLVCLDISMPGMNGYETLDAIRKFEDARNTPPTAKAKVLIITAFADEECLLKTYDKCQGYIIKPIRVQKLSEKLAALGVKPGAATHPASATRVAEDHSELANVIPLIVLRDGNYAVLSSASGAWSAQETVDPAKLEYFKNVVQGQLVARVDLSAAKLPLGQGLYLGPDQCSIYASDSGMVVFRDGKLLLEGSIVFEGGLRESLDFVGSVEVKGDVYDGVSLRASRGIKVDGVARGCELKSEGDIEVQRVDGRGRAFVRCGGSFSCDFLYGAKVEAKGSISVRREALNVEMKAADSIDAAIFAGGLCMALNKIELGRAGSPNDPGTVIKGGVNFHLLDRKLSLEKRLHDTDARISFLRQMLGPYADDIGLAVMLYEERRRKIYDYDAELKALEALRVELQKEYDEIKAIPHSKDDPAISVEHLLHKGVKVSIGDLEEIVPEDLKGPFSVSETLIRI